MLVFSQLSFNSIVLVPSRGFPMAKPKVSSEDVTLCRQWFQASYPVIFGPPVLPLKIGVTQEIHKALPQQFKRKALQRVMAKHTGSRIYLEAVRDGTTRYDLAGHPCESIAPEHKALAIKALEDMASKLELRRPSELDRAKAKRSALLKAFEAMGEDLGGLAAQEGCPEAQLRAVLDQALTERMERRTFRSDLVERFRQSGLTTEAFCAHAGIAPATLSRAIAKVELVVEQPT
jgi:sRNA-binding protein